MGRTFETLRRRDAAHRPAGEAPPPTRPPAASPRASATVAVAADFEPETLGIPFIEVGEKVEDRDVAALPTLAAPIPAARTIAANVDLGVRFLPNDAGTRVGLPGDPELVILSRPQSAEAIQYRQVRDALLGPMSRARVRSLLLAPSPGHSADLAALNLAFAFVENCERAVLLIDADLRGTPLALRLGLGAAPGWAELMLGVPAAQVLQQSGYARLHVIAAGNRLVGARALLQSAAVTQQILELNKDYDVILVRAPDGQQAVEAQALAHACDAVCFLRPKPSGDSPADHAVLLAWQRDGIRVLGTMVTSEECPLPQK